MNPCPCGWAGDRSNRCLCSDERINRYRARVSGPLLDRIDLHISVARMDAVELRESTPLGSLVLRYVHGWKPPMPSSRCVAGSTRICRRRHCGPVPD